ncbi:MAG: ferrous iron transport protein A [Anaerolineaceae bacterium]|nr:ferrous iron transport protein A [Anaerolineaceae bacterium]
MMPLLLADVGEENIIRKVGGSPEMKKHLEDLGFVVGGTVRVVSEINGNLIVILTAARSFPACFFFFVLFILQPVFFFRPVRAFRSHGSSNALERSGFPPKNSIGS